MEKHNIRSALIAAGAALAIYLIAVGAELSIIRMTHPSALELTWISDVLLAVAFGVVVYLQLDLAETRASLTQLQRERLVWDTELKLAAEIQRGLLPASPGRSGDFRWAGRLKQARKVGGDFYDVVQVAPDRLVFVVGDLSGKGIPAALIQSAAHNLLRMLIHNQINPSHLLEILSRTLYEEHRGNAFLTCFLAFVDTKRALLTYVDAGHPSGLLLRGSTPTLLDGGGPPVGLLPEVKYQETTVSLNRGDVGLFVTDGITEAAGGEGKGWIVKAQKVLAAEPSQIDPGRVCDKLMKAVGKNVDDLPFAGWVDDQTVLVLAFAPEAHRSVKAVSDSRVARRTRTGAKAGLNLEEDSNAINSHRVAASL